MSGGSELYLCTLTAHCKGTKQRRCCSHGSQALSKTENKLLGGTKEAFFLWEVAQNCLSVALGSSGVSITNLLGMAYPLP